ncbi:MAG: hypothetical protein EBS11_10300 [Janthinobacterium sp.]|nr:hypothetical protein [Janthinobacterium sp.]
MQPHQYRSQLAARAAFPELEARCGEGDRRSDDGIAVLIAGQRIGILPGKKQDAAGIGGQGDGRRTFALGRRQVQELPRFV